MIEISIHSLRMEGDGRLRGSGQRGKISIHSLRMEGDFDSCRVYQVGMIFQSTPSAWRETVFENCNRCGVRNFNPLPPHGGRLAEVYFCLWLWYFNPLPPHGGRLWYAAFRYVPGRFQSTPSAWRETFSNAPCAPPQAFQSTPSAWRET